jgi:peptidoglycan/xylan/chitin deacetylase (PgdA/CDA1 family)
VLAFLVITGWGTVVAAAVWLLRMVREESRADRIIGMLYHRVVPRSTYDRFRGTELIFSMPEDRFEAHLEWLLKEGYHFITLDQLEEHLKQGTALPEKPVHVTFDDGCASVHGHALPILKRLGIPATVFVTIDENAWIFHEGEYFERRLTVDEMRACSAGGISIGSHAVTHRGLNEMPRDQVLGELVESRQTLEDWCGVAVRHFAVPLNFYNRATLELCKEAGYGTVCTSDNGTSNADTSPYKIKRFIIEGSLGVQSFARTLTPRVIVQRRILNSLKKLPPKLLGEKLWMPLRERIFHGPLGPWLTFSYLRRALILGIAAGGALLLALTALLIF